MKQFALLIFGHVMMCVDLVIFPIQLVLGRKRQDTHFDRWVEMFVQLRALHQINENLLKEIKQMNEKIIRMTSKLQAFSEKTSER